MIGQLGRNLAALALVFVLRLTSQVSLCPATVIFCCIGATMIDVTEAGEERAMTPGKLRSLGETAMMERKYSDAVSLYRQAIDVSVLRATLRLCSRIGVNINAHNRNRRWSPRTPGTGTSSTMFTKGCAH